MNEKIKQTIRTFGLTTLSVKNSTTVFFLTAIILLFGVFAYMGMAKESFPEVKLPTIIVNVPYPGNSPENIEKLIVVPIEKELKSVSGIDKVNASALENYASIIVQFESDIEVEIALRDVKDAVDKAKNELPTDLDQDPSVSEINMGEVPVMNLNLYGDYTLDQLKDFGENLKDKIEDLDEITRVEIRGVEDKEVKINVDMYKLSALELNFDDIANAVASRNLAMSSGTFRANGLVTSLKVDGEFEDIHELEDLIVKHEKGNVVYLKDILASPIVLEPEEKSSYARFKGQNVVMLDVVKGSGKNLLLASENIMKILNERDQKNYTGIIPGSDKLNITITMDQSDQTRDQVANLENSIISGVILVVLVLLFFLGTRNALFVGLAIPMSMFLSFMILSAMGVTINMMVLFGLIMALGMLVDNGIVVVENVYRLMDEGKSAKDAAIEGVGEIAWPIISSTATTLAAFLPLAIWPGIMGEFMKYLPLTLIVVLGSSLFVALVINPVFTTLFMKVGEQEPNKKKIIKVSIGLIVPGIILALIGLGMEPRVFTVLGNLLLVSGLLTLLNTFALTPIADRFQKNFLPKLENQYERFLSYALNQKKPIIFFIGTWVLMVFSVMLVGIAKPKVEFFPDNEPRLINVFVEMPLGTEIEESNKIALALEDQINEMLDTATALVSDEPNVKYRQIVKAVIANVGKGTSDASDPFSGGNNTATPHKARITVEFVDYINRLGINTMEVQKLITDHLDITDFPNAVLVVDKDASGPPAGKPVNIEVSGDDFQTLIAQSQKVQDAIKASGVKGVEQLKSDLEQGKPEFIIDIDNAKAERLGVNTRTVALTLRTALFGREVSKYKDGDDDYPIQLRIKEEDRNNISSLMNQMITFRSQSSGQIVQVPINSIASIKPAYSFGSIRRKDYKKVITIYSNVLQGFNKTEVNNELKSALADLKLRDGYQFKFTGEQESQEKEMSFLSMALLLALFLILLIIVAQFNRISTPIIILTSVLLSTIGVFLGLVAFNMSFVIIMTMIGIISLAGIVVNNAIVLLDYSIYLMDEKKQELGMADQARLPRKLMVDLLVKAGKTRLRPVLLTAITTVLGLVPLAIGLNIDFFGLFTHYDPNVYIGGENVVFWGPMSWTIIFGITFATFLTLVIVPVMFLGVERLKYYLYTTKAQRQAEQQQSLESSSLS